MPTEPTRPTTAEDENTRYGFDDRFRVRVELDSDSGAENPRDSMTNVGVMVLSEHRRFALPREGDLVGEIDARLSDAQYGASPAERVEALAAWLKAEHGATVVLPVWAYDHGELHLKAGERTHPFDDVWDSALAGVIYDTPDTHEPDGELSDLVEALAEEVELYDMWGRGEIYRYVIERRDADGWNEVHTGCGYYSESDARKAAVAEIESGDHDATYDNADEAPDETSDTDGSTTVSEPIRLRQGRRGWYMEVLDTVHLSMGTALDAHRDRSTDEQLVAWMHDLLPTLATEFLPEGDPLRAAITGLVNRCRYCGAEIHQLDQAGAEKVNQAHPAGEDNEPIAVVGDWVTGRAGIKCPEADTHEPNTDA